MPEGDTDADLDGDRAAMAGVGRMATREARGREFTERVTVRAAARRERSSLIDVGVRVYDRARETTSSLLGSDHR